MPTTFTDTDKKSVTTYVVNVKGEEIADYAESWKNGAIDTVTTYFYHISGNEKATATQASADSYMTRSETKRLSSTGTLKQVT